jgi:hypothetical protein
MLYRETLRINVLSHTECKEASRLVYFQSSNIVMYRGVQSVIHVLNDAREARRQGQAVCAAWSHVLIEPIVRQFAEQWPASTAAVRVLCPSPRTLSPLQQHGATSRSGIMCLAWSRSYGGHIV